MKKGHHLQPHSFIDSSNLLCPFIKLTMAENIPIINHICLRAILHKFASAFACYMDFT